MGLAIAVAAIAAAVIWIGPATLVARAPAPVEAVLKPALAAIGVETGQRGAGPDTNAADRNGGQRKQRAVTVRAARVRQHDAVDRFRTTGEIAADDAIDVTPEIAGRVATIAVADGARVKTGDVLVSLDDAEARARVSAAEAALSQAANAYDRQQRLERRDFASEARLEEARAARASAQAELDRARETLAKHTIRAPFDAVVGFVNVSVGAYVTPGSDITTLTTPTRLRVAFSVPQALAQTVSAGDTVSVRAPNTRAPHAARIVTRAPVAARQTRSISAEALIDEAPDDLNPGMFVQVDVVVARREDALFVPETALLRRGQNAVVFKIESESDDDNGRAREISVETGSRRDALIEVVSPALRSGDRVVSSGLQGLRDGAPVAVQHSTDSEPAAARDKLETTDASRT